jgi:hypothetical protein
MSPEHDEAITKILDRVQKDKILCAAIWLDDGIWYPHQPSNIKTGLVYCGHRHCAIFQQFKRTPEERYAALKAGLIETQGFLTEKGLFANRKQAAYIAFKAGQTKEHKTSLTSEDLY